MTIMRVYAQAEVYAQPTFDVSYKTTTPVSLDEIVLNYAEELYPGATDQLFPEKIEKKIIEWFMTRLYPDLKSFEKQPPSPNGMVGEDALGIYALDEDAQRAVNDLVQEFLYQLAGAEFDYTDFKGWDWPKEPAL
jgi:hypothetical protein